MGFVLITESMSFIPSDYGIQNNIPVQVIAVGSGAGGGRSSYKGTAGGASGKAGNGCRNGAVYAGGGGGGGGFGGGGGGAGEIGDLAGAGGGAGAVAHKSMFFTDVDTAIAVTIGQPVAADTNGEASSFGSYLTAAGGAVNGGGAGYSFSEYGNGGGGGQGGFQLGYFLYSCKGGNHCPTDTSESTERRNGRGTGGGSGGGYYNSSVHHDAGLGGNGGGGNGSSNIYLPAQDGFNHLGEPGQGCVLLFW